MRIDVHQHLWPHALVAALRERRRSPRLAGWTLYLDGEPDYRVNPADHDVAARARLVQEDGLDRALISLSSPLGIEWLPPDEAASLLRAYHDGAVDLPEPFGGWAAAGLREPDPAALAKELDRGFVGLQLPATALLDAAGYEHCAPLLDVLVHRNVPLLLHPGAVATADRVPPWWPALVPYAQQMHQAWYALRAFGRQQYPRLRFCFAMLAGLAPLHGERFVARGGSAAVVDPYAFVETSSYGPRAIDATVRALGIDVVVLGSDRPYATAADHRLGRAADHAIRTTNPTSLLAAGGAQ